MSPVTPITTRRHRKLPALQTRVRDARKIAMAAIERASLVSTDPRIPRSTRTRSSYKIKAQGLDEVLRALNGK